jgi:hypothetical protein
MGNLYQMMQMYHQFMQNPMGVLSKKFNIPTNLDSPQAIIQHLLNTNQVSQQQVNQAMMMRNDPQIRNMFR